MTDAQRALDKAIQGPNHENFFGNEWRWMQIHPHVDKIRRALRLLAAVEAGEWKVVPQVPTKEMIEKGHVWINGLHLMNAGTKRDAMLQSYRSMIIAAPDFFAGEKEG